MIKRKRAERSYKCYIPILIGSCILASACSPKTGKPDELSEEKMEIIGEETEIEQWYTDNEHFRPDESVTAKRPVIIAILDSDISENVFYEKDVRWINEKEIPNDNIDNDKNGYADDVYAGIFAIMIMFFLIKMIMEYTGHTLPAYYLEETQIIITKA